MNLDAESDLLRDLPNRLSVVDLRAPRTKPSWRQATFASSMSHSSSQMDPQRPKWLISTLPSNNVCPPTKRSSPSLFFLTLGVCKVDVLAENGRFCCKRGVLWTELISSTSTDSCLGEGVGCAVVASLLKGRIWLVGRRKSFRLVWNKCGRWARNVWLIRARMCWMALLMSPSNVE